MTAKTKKPVALNASRDVARLRKKWNTHYNGVFSAADLKTNEILAECKTCADKIRTNADESKSLTKALNDLGFKPNIASSIYHKFLTLVMSDTYDDTRRKSVARWAKTLLIADSHGITGDKLVKWIEENGGINEIAYPDKDKEKILAKKQERIAIAETYFAKLAKVEANFSQTKNSPKQAGLVVMLGKVK